MKLPLLAYIEISFSCSASFCVVPRVFRPLVVSCPEKITRMQNNPKQHCMSQHHMIESIHTMKTVRIVSVMQAMSMHNTDDVVYKLAVVCVYACSSSHCKRTHFQEQCIDPRATASLSRTQMA